MARRTRGRGRPASGGRTRPAKPVVQRAPNYHLFYGLFGLAMGFVLTRIGFGDFDEVHKMWALIDLRMFYAFAGAVGVAMIGFLLLTWGQSLPQKPIHKGTIIGGLLFGVGWAVTGACPSTALLQVSAGYLPAVITIAGIVFGAWLYRIVHARFFRWDTGACDS